MAEPAPSAGPSRVADAPTAPVPAENGLNGAAHAADDDDDEDQLGPDGLPKNASETLYLHNLNEKVRIPGAYEARAAGACRGRCRCMRCAAALVPEFVRCRQANPTPPQS